MLNKNKRKAVFKIKSLHRKREPSAFYYLRQKASFLIAAFSVIAFITGNMVGSHGWYAFWKSVMGGIDDSLIVYTGTVTPVEKVPDYEKWAEYGGISDENTYRQVPQDVLVTLPRYQSAIQKNENAQHGKGSDVYSVGNLGSYATGTEGQGSHPGVDIRMPTGTPVRSIANGVVFETKEDSGFGKYVVIRHPNVPDPQRPDKLTALYSVYAHLNAVYVEKGAIVSKGEYIADSGRTGFVSGSHLHFQIDREEAPWHPYWPFTSAEAQREGLNFVEAVDSGLFQARGYLYTVNPMLYVQANYPPAETMIAGNPSAENRPESNEQKGLISSVIAKLSERVSRLQARRDERLRIRIARMQTDSAEAQAIAMESQMPIEAEKSQKPIVTSSETIASADNSSEGIKSILKTNVFTVDFRHDGEFSGRQWEKLTVILLDEKGDPIVNPDLNYDLRLVTAYGNADFKPKFLSPLDFSEGQAVMDILPRGKRTVVIQAMPFPALSAPIRFAPET